MKGGIPRRLLDNADFELPQEFLLLPVSLYTTMPNLRNRPKKYAESANIVKRLLPEMIDLVECSLRKLVPSPPNQNLGGRMLRSSIQLAPRKLRASCNSR